MKGGTYRELDKRKKLSYIFDTTRKI